MVLLQHPRIVDIVRSLANMLRGNACSRSLSFSLLSIAWEPESEQNRNVNIWAILYPHRHLRTHTDTQFVAYFALWSFRAFFSRAWRNPFSPFSPFSPSLHLSIYYFVSFSLSFSLEKKSKERYRGEKEGEEVVRT